MCVVKKFLTYVHLRTTGSELPVLTFFCPKIFVSIFLRIYDENFKIIYRYNIW